MSLSGYVFPLELPIVSSLAQHRIDHAGRENLPRLVGIPSEIFPKYDNDVEWEKTITNSWFATT